MVKFAKLLIKSIPILNQKAATENRAALRISFADSCSANVEVSYLKQKQKSQIFISQLLHSITVFQHFYNKFYLIALLPISSSRGRFLKLRL